MEATTKYNLGDTLSVIAGHAVKDITVAAIVLTGEGIFYRSPDYRTYEESECFASRQEVYDYILGKTNESDNQNLQAINTESNESI